ncbi:hypothetical protein Agub_g12908 [Astrephomene gubernaculifera]|uniref:Cyclin N-terminal domain-containing protein n=1 Tax=Astrephomene gubernaculifera TaxID=47775 RepID=A0AAD3HR14_9CHLO|nr:hypothetical protein Agub_g12908 [Astrephomene gubernaculifera]
MDVNGPGKRGASPCSHGFCGAETSTSGNSGKRCRQLASGHQFVWECAQECKEQPSTGLRRVQSAPIASDSPQQQTWDDLEHWRSREGACCSCPEEMGSVQHEITPAMRTMLVDWLAEVRDEFQLHTETLFLAVAYLDRYLCAKSVQRQRFQLLGLTCLWVAAKFEEVYPPPLHAMLAMAENMYAADDMRAMEKEVLFTLDFGLAVPTSLRFLHYLLQLSPLPQHPSAALSTRRLAEALLELTLLDTAFLLAPPSHVASCAVYLALGLVRHHAGLQGVVLISGAEPLALGDLVKRLSKVLHETASQSQPCALLFRYKAWEGLNGGQALAIAAATANSGNGRAQPAAQPRQNVASRHSATASSSSYRHGMTDQQMHFNTAAVAPAAANVAGGMVASDRCVVNVTAMGSLAQAAAPTACF